MNDTTIDAGTAPAPDAGPPAPKTCENCDTPLQGHYCHHCGQSMHNPIRHAGHAIEEFFEAFWHLDGRVFRTLRDLMVPGRVACGYIEGHRQRYIAPLRLFVILSVLAFFIGQLSLDLDSTPMTVGVDVSEITQATTEEEVREIRDRMLADLEQAREGGRQVPGVDATLIATQVQIQGEAADRIAELREASGAGPAPEDTTSEDAAPDGRIAPTGPGANGSVFSAGTRSWDPEADPVQVGWLPGFANRWLTRKMVHARDNIERMDGRPDLWIQAFMGSLPSALFLLVPLFALLLKLAYVFKGRLYLEHLVVALYSHVFLLLALAAMFLLSGLGSLAESALPWLSHLGWIGVFVLLVWMPVYLLLMQKRVYGQGWPMTVLKYLVIGNIYMVLLSVVSVLMFLATLAKG